MINKLKEWAEKIRINKKGLDKEMFDELIKQTVNKLEKEGYQKTFSFLNEHYIKGQGNRMNGVILLTNNSKQIKDKLWSISRKCGVEE